MRQTTICLLFVYFLSTFCPVFVLVLSCFCPRFVTTKTKNLSFVKIFRKKFCVFQIFQDKNQTNPKLFPENLDKWQFFFVFVVTNLGQNQDKNKTKSRQNVDKLSTNCRLSHSLASPLERQGQYWVFIRTGTKPAVEGQGLHLW